MHCGNFPIEAGDGCGIDLVGMDYGVDIWAEFVKTEMELGLAGRFQFSIHDVAAQINHHYIRRSHIKISHPAGFDRHQAFRAVVDAQVSPRPGGELGVDQVSSILHNGFSFLFYKSILVSCCLSYKSIRHVGFAAIHAQADDIVGVNRVFGN